MHIIRVIIGILSPLHTSHIQIDSWCLQVVIYLYLFT